MVNEPQLPLPAAVVLCRLLRRQTEVPCVQGRTVRATAVIGGDVLHRQVLASQDGAGRHAVGTEGLVALQIPAVIAHGGGQTHNGIHQVHLILPVRQGGQQAVDELELRQHRAVGQRHVFPGEAAGIHQSAGQQLVQGQDIPAAPGLILGQHPLVQRRPVTVLGPVGVGVLSVQTGVVQGFLRHDHLIAQRLRQIDHPVRVHGPVIQGHIGDGSGALPLRHRCRCPLRGRAAARQQQQAQQSAQQRDAQLLHHSDPPVEKSRKAENGIPNRVWNAVPSFSCNARPYRPRPPRFRPLVRPSMPLSMASPA